MLAGIATAQRHRADTTTWAERPEPEPRTETPDAAWGPGTRCETRVKPLRSVRDVASLRIRVPPGLVLVRGGGSGRVSNLLERNGSRRGETEVQNKNSSSISFTTACALAEIPAPERREKKRGGARTTSAAGAAGASPRDTKVTRVFVDR
ncbi:unnamed protein product [Merluccius merluccius]